MCYTAHVRQYMIHGVRSIILPSAACTPWLIGKFPSQYSGLIHVATNKRLDIILVCGLRGIYQQGEQRYRISTGAYNNVCICVEEIVVLSACDLANIHVHTTVVGPIVCPEGAHKSALGSSVRASNSQSNDEAKPVGLGCRNNAIYAGVRLQFVRHHESYWYRNSRDPLRQY